MKRAAGDLNKPMDILKRSLSLEVWGEFRDA